MADLLQVQIADLEVVETQLGTQAETLESAGTESRSIVNDIIAQLQNAANDGESRMTSLLENLDNVSQQTLNATDGAVWTGQNAERFRGATTELTQTITATNNATANAFAEFRTAITRLEENLDGLVTDFQTSVSTAQESTVSFAEAVRSQIDNYEHAFNTSLQA